MKARLTAISFGFAAVAAIVLFVVPVYSGFTDSQPVRATLIEINGKWVIVPVILPVVVAVVPWCSASRSSASSPRSLCWDSRSSAVSLSAFSTCQRR